MKKEVGNCSLQELNAYLSSEDKRVDAEPLDYSFAQLVNRLECRGLNHSDGFFHYTDWVSFLRMVLGTTKHPPFRLLMGNCQRMNDLEDRRCGAGTYFASFSYGREENIAMWVLYGRNKDNKIRIRVPESVMASWFSSRKDYATGVDDSMQLIKVAPYDIHISDVGYYRQREGYEKTDHKPPVYYRRSKINVREYGWLDNLKEHSPERILFKRSGWSYEREIRLHAICENHERAHSLSIDFEKPLRVMLNRPKECIVLGPWFDAEKAVAKLDEMIKDIQDVDMGVVSQLREIATRRDICSLYTDLLNTNAFENIR